jgi:NTP pyrophosphatase (non-canonical NTP hydrolase)
MLVQDYVGLALRTETEEANSTLDRLDHAAMGLVTESGELVDALKKHKRYGREFDMLNFCEELGDVAWYTALAADALGLSFPEMLAAPHHKEAAQTTVGLNLNQIGLIDYNVGLLVHHAAEFYMIVRRMRYVRRTFAQDMNKLPVHVARTLHTIDHLAQLGGFTLESVLEANIAKLMKRYAGKFTKAEATERDIEAEMKALADAMVDSGVDPVLAPAE